jgi:hypothetical protein
MLNSSGFQSESRKSFSETKQALSAPSFDGFRDCPISKLATSCPFINPETIFMT